MYKQATQMRLRFHTVKGQLSVEDLWKLPLTSRTRPSLDGIAIETDAAITAQGRQSFVTPAATADTLLELKLNILKDIIATRQEENAATVVAGNKAVTNARIKEIIAGKKDEALAGKTVEELEAMIA